MKPEYGFRALTEKDLPMVRRWMDGVHWRQWWGEADAEIADIAAHIGSVSVEPMIAELDGKAIAYVQVYDPHLEDGHPYQDQPTGTLGIDLSIGEADMIHRGHGSAILSALAAMLFDEGAPRLVIDPDPANLAAIRAYEKAGFRAFDTRLIEYGPALMMALGNPDFEEEAQ